MDNIRELNIEDELQFEAFCDKSFINQVSDEELKKFAELYFLNSNNSPNFIQTSEKTIESNGRIELSKNDINKDITAYCIYDNISRNNQLEIPNIHIAYCPCFKISQYDFSDKFNPITKLNYISLKHIDYLFSDYSMSENNKFSIDPAFFMFMYKKFGSHYINVFLEKRELYKSYYLSKEKCNPDFIQKFDSETLNILNFIHNQNHIHDII